MAAGSRVSSWSLRPTADDLDGLPMRVFVSLVSASMLVLTLLALSRIRSGPVELLLEISLHCLPLCLAFLFQQKRMLLSPAHDYYLAPP